MSYEITVKAKTPEELREKVEALLNKSFFVVSETTTVVNEEDDGEEMEEVKSPYSAPLSTVVDNEVDSEGLPWDGRIHSSSKNKNKDGSWKLVKGVDKALVPVVKTELRARLLANAGTPMAQAPAPLAPAPTQQAAPVVNLPSAAPALPQMQSGHTLQSFKDGFAMIIANLITQGKLTQDYVNTLKNHFGVAEIWQASDEQKAACFSEFVKCGLVQQVG